MRSLGEKDIDDMSPNIGQADEGDGETDRPSKNQSDNNQNCRRDPFLRGYAEYQSVSE